MAASATKRAAPRARRPAAKGSARTAKRKVTHAGPKAAVKQVAEGVTPGKKSPSLSGLAGFAARKALNAMVRRAAKASARALRSAAEQTALTGKAAAEKALSNRLPIQVSLDVAVPVPVAWSEWVNSSTLTEGVHRVENVERDGDLLFGTLGGPRSSEWEAEILDERENESFAWRSQVGSDCAGLVTFHRLSDSLTRIELDLDVLPTNPAQAISMSLRLARRRAESDLRRFKAHVEFINPDVYAPELNEDGDAPKSERED